MATMISPGGTLVVVSDDLVPAYLEQDYLMAYGYDPTASAEQQAFTNSLDTYNSESGRTSAEAALLGAQSSAINSYLGFRGPENLSQYANVMRGSTDASYPAFMGAMQGYTNSLTYAPTTASDLTPFTAESAGLDDEADSEEPDSEEPDSEAPQQAATSYARTIPDPLAPAGGAPLEKPPPVPATPQEPYQPGQHVGAARGTMQVVRGPQTFRVGEGGRDELVYVVPLQNRQVPVPRWAANLGNRMVPGSPYRPTARHAAPPRRMASGGATAVYGSGSPGVLSPGSTITSGNQPFDDGSGVSSTGQVQVPTGYDDQGVVQYETVPQYEATPYLSSEQWSSDAIRNMSPLELSLLQSDLEARGADWESEWHRYQQSLPRQQVPTAARYVR